MKEELKAFAALVESIKRQLVNEMKQLALIGDPASFPFHINSKETFDLIGGIGRVWFALLDSLPAAVMGGGTANGSAKEKPTQRNKPNGNNS